MNLSLLSTLRVLSPLSLINVGLQCIRNKNKPSDFFPPRNGASDSHSNAELHFLDSAPDSQKPSLTFTALYPLPQADHNQAGFFRPESRLGPAATSCYQAAAFLFRFQHWLLTSDRMLALSLWCLLLALLSSVIPGVHSRLWFAPCFRLLKSDGGSCFL